MEDTTKSVSSVKAAPHNNTEVQKISEKATPQDNTEVQKTSETTTTPVAAEKTVSVSAANTDKKFSDTSEDFEKGKIAGLQEAILAIMEKNGPVTDQMRKDVTDNVYHDSLINWIKSFR